MPRTAPDPIATVVAVRIAGVPEVESLPIYPDSDGRLRLHAMEANLHGSHLQYEADPAKQCIGFWTDPADWVDWEVQLERPGRYRVTLETAAVDQGMQLLLRAGSATLHVTVPRTGDYTKFQRVEAGSLELPAGRFTLEVRPIRDHWRPVNLRSIQLQPVD